MTPSSFPVLVELWREAPRWRVMAVSAAISTVLAIVFWPTGGASRVNPSGRYSPPVATGSPVAPPIPIDGNGAAASVSGGGTATASGGRSPRVLPVVEPAVPKIKPSQVGPVNVQTERSKEDDHAIGTKPKKNIIAPSMAY